MTLCRDKGRDRGEKEREREKRHQKGNDSDSKLMKGSSSVSLVVDETESQCEDYTLQDLFFLERSYIVKSTLNPWP